MVMGRRPDVPTASLPLAAAAVGGLAGRLGVALASVPFSEPWRGPGTLVHNVGSNVTRQVMRAFMGYATSLPTPELRSTEIVIDDLSRAALTPLVSRLGVEMENGEVGGVPGTWYRLRKRPVSGTILYLHGGGYVATSPSMYALFTGWLCYSTGCEVYVADYRLAPEFPFPAGAEDALSVYQALLDSGRPASRIVLAGDSGGGGLLCTLFLGSRLRGMPQPAGSLLFSPEVDLVLDEPSVTRNEPLDILPRQIPVRPYLRDLDPHDKYVSAIYADLHGFPPTLVAYGGEEVFHDAIERFVKDLRRDTVPTVAIEAPEMFHVYMILMPWADASRRLYRAISRFVPACIDGTIVDDIAQRDAERLAGADQPTDVTTPPPPADPPPDGRR